MAGRRAAGEGSLFQRQTGRHKGKWVARIECGRDAKGKLKRKDFLFPTQALAKEKLKEMNSDKDKGREPAAKSPVLSAYLEDWLEKRIKVRVSPNTYERYRSGVAVHIKPDEIATLKLKEVKATKINDFMDRMAKKGAGAATRSSVRAVLSAALQQALKEELVYDNQVRTSDAPRQAEKKIKFLTIEQAKKLMEKARGNALEPLIVAAIYTGMRLSELLGLTWDRVDFAKSTITIDRQLQRYEKAFSLAPLKTRGGRRTIPMADAVSDKFKALKGGSVLTEDKPKAAIPGLIFLAGTGQPHHRKTVLEDVNELMKTAKVPEVGFHALRHTCASILINKGADALRVQRQLGHSNVRMTLETYSHLFEERLKENVGLLENALEV